MRTQPRVLSLLPAATEIVCAIGGRSQLVGRSHACDYPDGLDAVPVVCRPRVDVNASSGEIDRAVNEAALAAVSLFEVLPGAIEAAKPDVILTQSLCSRCAVDAEAVEAAVVDLAGQPVEVLSMSPTSLDDVAETFRQVGEAIRCDSKELLRDFQSGLEAHGRRTGTAGPQRVLCLDWTDPPMQAALWVPELVALVGGSGRLELDATGQSRSLEVDTRRLAELKPDVIVSAPCGFELPRAIAETEAMLARPEWQSLLNDCRIRVFAADGSNFFNRPGPRLVETAEVIAAAIDPRAASSRLDGRMQRLR